MKITLSRSFKETASALLTVMVLGGILCLFVLYYLALIEQQSKLSARSQAWNMAIAVTEAGIEEGLQELQSCTLNLTTDPLWTYDGARYWRTNTMPDGNSYVVYIDIATDPFNPTVVARSFVTLPTLAMNTPPYFLAAAGVSTVPGTVNRAVKVRTTRGSLFIKGMVAKHRIDMNGNNIDVDSFDSRDLWHSWFGHYPGLTHPQSTPKDGGDIATNDSLANSMTTGNANIYGHASTGPGGMVAVGSQGGVGERSWQATHSGQVEPGWFADNSNFTFPEPSLPYTNGLPPVGPQKIATTTYTVTSSNTTVSTYPSSPPWSGVQTNIIGTNTVTAWPGPKPGLSTNWASMKTHDQPAPGTYLDPPGWSKQGANYYYTGIDTYSYWNINFTYARYTTNSVTTTNTYDNVIPTSGDYYVDSLSGNTIVLGGNARLVIGDGLSMSGKDTLVVAPGASVQIYSAGTSCTVGGNGIINQNGYASNLTLYCTPSVTSVSFNGNGEFIGVLVAPDAHIAMNGGGKSSNDFIGSIIADSITMNGHFSFHYDEALGANTGNARMLITSWDEIP
jgi:hypothetical protein